MKPAATPKRCLGFSLLELLIVIAVMGILLVLTVPAITSTLEGNNITRGGQMVADQISLARQIASTRNLGVEVRFIKIPSRSTQGYSALQIWTINSSGDASTAHKVVTLPEGIVVSETAQLSPLFSLPQALTGSLPAGGPSSGAAYAGLRIQSSGEISPPPATGDRAKLYLTLLNARLSGNSGTPTNYLTIQINPDTGNTQIYRP